MTEYGTLRVPQDALDAARKSKGEDETWGEFIRRCSENPPVIREFVEADHSDTDTDAVLRRLDDLETDLTRKIEALQR